MIRPLLMMTTFLLCSSIALAQQNCQTNVVETSPSSRFTISATGTVTDTETGLTWKRCMEGYNFSGGACSMSGSIIYTWQEALQLGSDASFAGQTDWRLPNAKELASITEMMCQTPALNEVLFPNTQIVPLETWTSSPHAGNNARAWMRNFDTGFDFIRDKINLYYVRLVRGG